LSTTDETSPVPPSDAGRVAALRAVPGLGGIAARGAAVTMGGQVAGASVRFASLVVLARMLTPHDYGIVAMVTAIVGVGELLRDFGLANAAIQAPDLSRRQRDNLFWMNTALGLVVGGGIAACALPIAQLYGEPAVGPVVVALSMTLLLNGVAAQHRASMMRAMRFSRVAAIDFVALAVGVVAAILCALAGLGYWALVVQELTKGAVMCVGVIAAARWAPRGPDRATSMRGLVSFGADLVGTSIVDYVSRNIDSVVIGARFGPTATGLYNRAFGLMALPMAQILSPAARVTLPVLSRLRTDRDQFRRYLLTGQTIFLHVAVPLFVLGIVLAEPLVRVVLGEAWLGTVPLLRVLAVGGIFEVLAFPTSWVFQPFGATRSQLRFVLSTRPLIVVAVLAGSSWGTVGVATGFAAATTLIWPVGVLWVSRALGAPGRALFANGLRALVGYVVCGVAAWFVLERGPSNAVVDVALGVATFVAVAALLVVVWHPFGRDVRLALGSRSLLSSRARSASADLPTPVPVDESDRLP